MSRMLVMPGLSTLMKQPLTFGKKSRYNPGFTTKWAGFHRPFFLGVCFCIFVIWPELRHVF